MKFNNFLLCILIASNIGIPGYASETLSDNTIENATLTRVNVNGIYPFGIGQIPCDFSPAIVALEELQQKINNLQLDVSGTCIVNLTDVCTTLALTQTTFIITTTTIESLCNAIPITASLVISDPGYYCLENDIVGTIAITADNVTLDLNNHTISASIVGVDIAGGVNRTVKNGRLDGHTTNGITVANTTILKLENLVFTNCGTGVGGEAFLLTGACSQCIIDNIITEQCSSGITFNGPGINNIVLKNFSITDCTVGDGITLNSVRNVLINQGTIESTVAAGISVDTANILKINNIVMRTTAIPFNFDVVDNLSMNNCLLVSSPEGINGTSSVNLLFNDITLSNIGNPAVGASHGISLLDCNEVQCNNFLITDIKADLGPAGYLFTNCDNVIAQDCLTQQAIATTNQAAGYAIVGSTNLLLNRCTAMDITGPGQDANGFFVGVVSNNVVLNECVAMTCTSNNGTGFNIQSGNTALSYCYTSSSRTTGTIGGFFVQSNDTFPISLQQCQSNFNVGSGYFINILLGVSNVIIGNCVAIGNSQHGFTGIGLSPSIYNCFSTRNTLNEYDGPLIVNVNNASDQVDPSVLAPNGPFAAGNIQVTP